MVNERRINEESPMKCHQTIYSICVKKWSPVDYGDGPAGFRQGHPHRATKGVHVGGYMRRGSKHDVPYGITVLKNGNWVPPKKCNRGLGGVKTRHGLWIPCQENIGWGPPGKV